MLGVTCISWDNHSNAAASRFHILSLHIAGVSRWPAAESSADLPSHLLPHDMASWGMEDDLGSRGDSQPPTPTKRTQGMGQMSFAAAPRPMPLAPVASPAGASQGQAPTAAAAAGASPAYHGFPGVAPNPLSFFDVPAMLQQYGGLPPFARPPAGPAPWMSPGSSNGAGGGGPPGLTRGPDMAPPPGLAPTQTVTPGMFGPTQPFGAQQLQSSASTPWGWPRGPGF